MPAAYPDADATDIIELESLVAEALDGHLYEMDRDFVAALFHDLCDAVAIDAVAEAVASRLEAAALRAIELGTHSSLRTAREEMAEGFAQLVREKIESGAFLPEPEASEPEASEEEDPAEVTQDKIMEQVAGLYEELGALEKRIRRMR